MHAITKVRALIAVLLMLAAVSLTAQTTLPEPTLENMDSNARTLATQVAAAISSSRSGNTIVKVAVGNFLFNDSQTQLGQLWTNNLQSGLVDTGNRAFSVLATPGGQDFTLQGEIVNLGEQIRIYTRLIRSADNSIVFNRHHDLGLNQVVANLLGRNASAILPRDPFEPNDSRESATLINLTADGASLQANFHNDSDVDWYRFVLTGAERGVRIATSGNQDTMMELVSANGQTIADDDDSGEEYNARVQTRLSPGTYFVRVQDYDKATGDYQLTISFVETPRPDEYEPDNSTSQAKTIAVNATPQQRSFHEPDDADWVRLVITRAGLYRINATAQPGTTLDTYLELYNTQESMIASDDDGGGDLNSQLEIQLQPGTYFIKVYPLDTQIEDQGRYTLSVSSM